MERNLQADGAALRAVLEAAQRGEHARAAQLAGEAMAAGLMHPLLLNVQALQCELEGRVADAERLLRRAVQMAPGDLGSRNALGLCQLRLERPAEALQQFDALLVQSPGSAFVHVSRGNALRALGAIGEAEASYLRALELDPNQGMAMAGLAQVASSRGAYLAARSWAGSALKLLPEYPEAIMSLAAAEVGEREPELARQRITQLLANPGLTPLERAYAHGLLGDALDALARPAEAFAAYSECNGGLRRLYAGKFSGPSALDYVRRMVAYFERAPSAWKQRAAPAAADEGGAASHVFLLGFPRSGTTLLEVILEGHPQVVALEEKESLIDAVAMFMRRPRDLTQLTQADPATLRGLRAAYWRRVAEAGAEVTGRCFLDKHPLNTLKLPLIARLFPDAKIIIAGRDPRDIVLSCFRHRFQMSPPIYELLSLEGAARYYDAVMQLLIHATSIMPLTTCLVRHEDVVTEFAREMRRICAFLGLRWVPEMGDFALRTRSRGVLTPSTAQLSQGLRTEGLGQWRRYRTHIDPLAPLLDPWVKRFFYDG